LQPSSKRQSHALLQNNNRHFHPVHLDVLTGPLIPGRYGFSTIVDWQFPITSMDDPPQQISAALVLALERHLTAFAVQSPAAHQVSGRSPIGKPHSQHTG
jgi:hypothetical protein